MRWGIALAVFVLLLSFVAANNTGIEQVRSKTVWTVDIVEGIGVSHGGSTNTTINEPDPPIINENTTFYEVNITQKIVFTDDNTQKKTLNTKVSSFAKTGNAYSVNYASNKTTAQEIKEQLKDPTVIWIIVIVVIVFVLIIGGWYLYSVYAM